MAVYLGALVRLGACTKGSPFEPEAITLTLNGVSPYPNFATVAAGGIEGECRENGPAGTVISSTESIASLQNASIVPVILTQGTTASLTCERMYWTCRAIDGVGIKTPLCYGWIPVRPT